MKTASSITLARFGNFTFSASLSALLSSIILWLLFFLFGFFLLSYSLPKALIMALAALILHWIADLLHQAGHALAARSTGYPITGIHLWGLLSSTSYPADEPALPKSTHIRRAMGGPLMSLVVSILSGIIFLFLWTGSWNWWLDLFFFLDNLLVFTIGALLPLGFTDGSTFLRLNSTHD